MNVKRKIMAALGVAVLALSTSTFAASISFDAAIETYAQPGQGGWTASLAIDGSTNGDYNRQNANGWAIQSPGTSDPTITPQSAFFRFSSALSLSSTDEIQIKLYQLFNDNGGNLFHTLGAFSLSVTGDDLSTFNVTSASGKAWTVLQPPSLILESVPSGTVPDYDNIAGNIYVDNPGLARAIYTFTTIPGISTITGIRLTVLSDTDLPKNGPGFAPSNGNFVLNEITVDGPAGSPVPLPAAAGVGFAMLGGIGMFAGLRKRLRRQSRIA